MAPSQTSAVRALIEQIPEESWTSIEYPEGGVAQVAEIEYQDKIRLIVRRTSLVGPQAKLWPDWRHHAFITNRIGATVDLDADYRRHAVIELAIGDLKEGAGMCHCPSGKFFFISPPAGPGAPPSEEALARLRQLTPAA